MRCASQFPVNLHAASTNALRAAHSYLTCVVLAADYLLLLWRLVYLCRFSRSDQQLAALRVVSVVIDSEAFSFGKAFPHVTVWKATGVKAVESNQLNAENAQVVKLAAPLSLAAAVRIV